VSDSNFPDSETPEAAIPAHANAVLYGKGVFTSIAIYDGQPFLWEKHWRRLQNDAATLAIDISDHSERSSYKKLEEQIELGAMISGRARLTFLDVSRSKLWGGTENQRAYLLISTGEVRNVPNDLRMTISPYRVNSRSPLAGTKSCNYMENIAGLFEAKSRSFEEAIQLNERDEITSATMANVFWLKDNVLHTPSLTTGCLPGTTREFVMENLGCREVEKPVDDLQQADAIFLTSAGLGVVRAAEFEGRKLMPVDHPILHVLPNSK